MSKIATLAGSLDKLYEFDREPVTPDKFQTWNQFAGMFAGEHVAATEFVIGAFFVLHGVTAPTFCSGFSSATSWPSCPGPSSAPRSPCEPD
jgi:hypothetical protein